MHLLSTPIPWEQHTLVCLVPRSDWNGVEWSGVGSTGLDVMPTHDRRGVLYFSGQGPIAHNYLHIGIGILLLIVILACLSIYKVHLEYRSGRKKAHDPLDNVPGDEDEAVALYSPQHTTSVEEKQSPSRKLFVDTGHHHCQHVTTSQAHLPSLQNGVVVAWHLIITTSSATAWFTTAPLTCQWCEFTEVITQ
ncbi:cubilin [Echinococcus multilocularis]|uniref:Cubilin n=1 Tax=Echinococcus multilocularis TaxID=6211 RepID=A0A0S4MMI4_ECHMU|nr:cubilin [Echinococcus multilocularis]CUT99487.1 cubilin [Echinococcus multilocularis]